MKTSTQIKMVNQSMTSTTQFQENHLSGQKKPTVQLQTDSCHQLTLNTNILSLNTPHNSSRIQSKNIKDYLMNDPYSGDKKYALLNGHDIGRGSQFFKTKICPWYPEKRCRMGHGCNWAHSNAELRPSVDLTNTKLCESLFKHGKCFNPNCRFAHSRYDLRASSNLYKTSLCVFYLKGRCDAGSSCRYAHGHSDLRTVDNITSTEWSLNPITVFPLTQSRNHNTCRGNKHKHTTKKNHYCLHHKPPLQHSTYLKKPYHSRNICQSSSNDTLQSSKHTSHYNYQSLPLYDVSKNAICHHSSPLYHVPNSYQTTHQHSNIRQSHKFSENSINNDFNPDHELINKTSPTTIGGMSYHSDDLKQSVLYNQENCCLSHGKSQSDFQHMQATGPRKCNKQHVSFLESEQQHNWDIHSLHPSDHCLSPVSSSIQPPALPHSNYLHAYKPTSTQSIIQYQPIEFPDRHTSSIMIDNDLIPYTTECDIKHIGHRKDDFCQNLDNHSLRTNPHLFVSPDILSLENIQQYPASFHDHYLHTLNPSIYIKNQKTIQKSFYYHIYALLNDTITQLNYLLHQ